MTNGVAVATVPPATAAAAVEEPSTTVMPPSPVLSVRVSVEDVLPAFWSVTASESVSPLSRMRFPAPPSRTATPATWMSGACDTVKSKEAVSA